MGIISCSDGAILYKIESVLGKRESRFRSFRCARGRDSVLDVKGRPSTKPDIGEKGINGTGSAVTNLGVFVLVS